MILYYINVGGREKEVMFTVYQHRNLKNGKSYVGMTSQEPKRRWGNGWGYKNNSRMWKDIQESDWNKDWEHNILGKFENEQDALKYESFLIAMLDSVNNGYNISSYDSNHYKHSEESKKKMSESVTGEKHPMFGKHHSEESKKKMSESKTGNHNSPTKPVIQFSKDGEFIAEYPSTMEAERQTGCNQGHICKCCKGKRKSCGGFIWKYK